MKGLGNEGGDGDVDLGAVAVVVAADGHDAVGQVGNGLGVLDGLGGLADHEVELDGAETALEGHVAGFQQVLVRDFLIDDPAHAGGGGFRGEGEAAAALAAALQGVRHVHVEGLDAGGGDGHADVFLRGVVDVGNDAIQSLVVHGIQGEQRDLALAR